jgi:transposase-like protein
VTQAPIRQELIDELMADYKSPKDLTGPDGLLQQLIGRLIEAASDGELTEHLGYERGDPAGQGSGNSRNGTTPKTLISEHGEIPVGVARDGNGTFEPQIVPKGETHWGGFDDPIDDQIVALDADGMSVEEIRGFLASQYHVEVSKDFISRVTDSVLDDVRAWQTRPLDECYPVIWIDALVVKIRVDGVVRNRPAYLILGLNVLAEAGVLTQRNEGRQRYRVFEATDVLDLFTALERALASPTGDTRVERPARCVPKRPET